MDLQMALGQATQKPHSISIFRACGTMEEVMQALQKEVDEMNQADGTGLKPGKHFLIINGKPSLTKEGAEFIFRPHTGSTDIETIVENLIVACSENRLTLAQGARLIVHEIREEIARVNNMDRCAFEEERK